ncbi:PREDICTED: homeobox protein Mohawk [Calidris pugnax]|uniref:homeobox protein Mohawk n=1 Tax=Calidris pugnax TaxID=198806 RepID=UPI00071E63C2|nr:PREDICTED: homeobox protein Mohawk [Calidris pugnax]
MSTTTGAARTGQARHRHRPQPCQGLLPRAHRAAERHGGAGCDPALGSHLFPVFTLAAEAAPPKTEPRRRNAWKLRDGGGRGPVPAGGAGAAGRRPGLRRALRGPRRSFRPYRLVCSALSKRAAGRSGVVARTCSGGAGRQDAGCVSPTRYEQPVAAERGCRGSAARPGSAQPRTARARQSGGKVRHKRQALQDMARPLKQWLYKHRDNPYPTKTEKILLALGSQMTLVQVSNWFANARRRLKNTVRQPDLSWALRIKLYNKYVQGNAERLSVSSDDSCSEDGENPPRNHMNEGGYNKPVHHTVIKTESSVIKTGVRPETSANEDYVSPPKYKSSLLNRYLNDSLRHVMATNAAMMEKTRQRNHSGSFSSNEFEEELVSPSSSETEGNFVYRTETLENGPNKCESAANRKGTSKDETYWKEINAAMALTNLAQGKDKLQGTTSCIIQKSSHISEVKTVKVPLVQQF